MTLYFEQSIIGIPTNGIDYYFFFFSSQFLKTLLVFSTLLVEFISVEKIDDALAFLGKQRTDSCIKF